MKLTLFSHQKYEFIFFGKCFEKQTGISLERKQVVGKRGIKAQVSYYRKKENKNKTIQLSSVIEQLKEATGVIFKGKLDQILLFLKLFLKPSKTKSSYPGLKGQTASSKICPSSPPTPRRTPWLFYPKGIASWGPPCLSSCCLCALTPDVRVADSCVPARSLHRCCPCKANFFQHSLLTQLSHSDIFIPFF